MLRKYILIGILVIVGALAISAFAWVSTSRSSRSQVDKSKDDLYSAPSGPYLVTVGQYNDKRYFAPSSSYLVTVDKSKDDLYFAPSSPYLVTVGQYHDR